MGSKIALGLGFCKVLIIGAWEIFSRLKGCANIHEGVLKGRFLELGGRMPPPKRKHIHSSHVQKTNKYDGIR